MALHGNRLRAFRLVDMAGAAIFGCVRRMGLPDRPAAITDSRRRAGRPIPARLNANTEKSLADEAGGPVAQLLPVPQDGGDDFEDDPLAMLRKDIRDARGKALLVETHSTRLVHAGFGLGTWTGGFPGTRKRISSMA